MEHLPLDRYAEIRRQLGAWAFGIARHGWPFFLSIICGSAGTIFQYFGGNMTAIVAWTVAMASFLVAAFLGWRDERGAKEKAIQPIAGIWTRRVFPTPEGGKALGVATLEFDGNILTGSLVEGEIDHEINGTYNAEKRQFEVTVTRTHRLGVEQREIQEATYWIIGNDTLLYYTANNGKRRVEQGIYMRKDSKPLWLPWTIMHEPISGKPQSIECYLQD